MNKVTMLVAGLACSLTAGALAQDHPAGEDAPKAKPLLIGDKAPAVKVARYFRGTPVKNFEPGKVYVMEFWATWCGPCVRQIPHLAKLQKEFQDRDVQVVSTAVWQREDTQALREKKVAEFVKDKGDAMAYTVAIDDEGWMADHWMKPAGQNGIPAAFLVGKTGIVEWIGHPASIDPVITSYLSGTWDRDQARAKMEEERRFEERGRAIWARFREAQQAQDREAARAILEEAAAEFPQNPSLRQARFEFLLESPTTAGEGYEIGNGLVEEYWNDPGTLNYVSWHVAANPKVARRDLDFAMKAATRADELAKHEDASIIDTLARVYWEKDDKDRAIALQKKAIDVADERMKPQLQETLDRYKASE